MADAYNSLQTNKPGKTVSKYKKLIGKSMPQLNKFNSTLHTVQQVRELEVI